MQYCLSVTMGIHYAILFRDVMEQANGVLSRLVR